MNVAGIVAALTLAYSGTPDQRHLHYTAADTPAAASIEKALTGSDDFKKYRAAFVKSSAQLIASGQCALEDFENVGGWVKSTNHSNEPVYFTYCGGMTNANRIYLNVSSGRTFR
ncbi:MAG: hypothetical protein LCH56_06540 [Proteobacteria bacterium]|nr:hypothetical protein [Pseudomonadota bacterium]